MGLKFSSENNFPFFGIGLIMNVALVEFEKDDAKISVFSARNLIKQ